MKIYVNACKKGKYRRHVVESGHNQTVCGLFLKHKHQFLLSDKKLNCKKCIEILERRLNHDYDKI